MKPLKGALLLAEPFMNDGFFERTVVLICDHDTTGTMGLVLNRPYSSGFIKLEGISEVNSLMIGGPVNADSLMIMHKDPTIREAWPISGDYYLNGETEQIITEWKDGNLDSTNCFFFLGYAGWGEGQLEMEISNGGWIVFEDPGNVIDKIFEVEPEKRWATAMKSLGGKHAEMAHYPKDPRLN